jgi:hypothetical protein
VLFPHIIQEQERLFGLLGRAVLAHLINTAFSPNVIIIIGKLFDRLAGLVEKKGFEDLHLQDDYEFRIQGGKSQIGPSCVCLILADDHPSSLRAGF